MKSERSTDDGKLLKSKSLVLIGLVILTMIVVLLEIGKVISHTM